MFSIKGAIRYKTLSKMNACTLPELEITLFSLYKCRDKHFTLRSNADMYLIFTKNK